MNLPAPFSQNQDKFFWRCFNSWFNVAEGGKRGGKNVLITMAYCSILEKHPSKIHLIAGVSTSTARLNILDCDGYGMMNFFEGRCRTGQYQNRDCLYIKTPTGEKIVLVSGGGKAGDERLIKGNTYGTAYITEANECHPNFIQEVFDRTISSPDRKIFHDLNPKAPGHWYYDILGFHENQQDADPSYGYNYGHFSIADNMSISDEQLRQILKTYDKSSVWYKRDILGQRCIADGLVYPMFTEDKVEPDDAERKYRKYMISMDYGTRNPTSMGLWGLCDGTWYRFKEYYFDSRAEMAQKTDQEYYDDLCKFAGDLPVDHIIIDPSALSFITLVEKNRRFKVWTADNDVLDGIRHTAQCISDGTIKICATCKNAIKEFGLYSWDEDATEDKPIKENDHCLAGDTVVNTVFGGRKIKYLVGKFGFVWSYNEKRKKKCIRPFFGVKKTRENQQILKITLENGKVVRCTPEHRILTDNGWIEAKYLTQSSKIIDINAIHLVGVSKIEIEPNEDVYNMEVMGTHNFAVNGGVIVHNCMDDIRYFVQTTGIWNKKSGRTLF